MRTRYRSLDNAIIAHLERDPHRHPIYVSDLAWAAANELGRDMPRDDNKEGRLIDRRLQALRTAGRIRYVREPGCKPRWEVFNAERGLSPNQSDRPNSR